MKVNTIRTLFLCGEQMIMPEFHAGKPFQASLPDFLMFPYWAPMLGSYWDRHYLPENLNFACPRPRQSPKMIGQPHRIFFYRKRVEFY